MQLLTFELYKIFKQKVIFVTFLLLLVFTTGFTWDQVTSQEKEMYQKWEGPITEEKAQQAELENAELMKKVDKMQPGQFLSDKEQTLSGIYENIAYIQQAESNLEERVGELEEKSTYNSQLERKLIQGTDLSYFSYNKGPMETIDYASFYSLLVTGAMLLLGLSTIYSQESSTGVDNYILSSIKGRSSLMWAKISASLIYTMIVILAWELFNLVFHYIKYGSDGWSTPIQYLFKYYFSPYGFSMTEFHLIQLGIHLLAAFSFSLVILFISSICRNSLVSFLVNGVIFALPVMFVEMLKMPNLIEDIFRFSFIYIMKVEFLFENFKTANLFGYPVLYPIIAILLMIAIALLFVMMTTQVVKRKEVTS